MKKIIDKLSNKSLSDILVIEDNPDDVFLIELAIKKANIKSCISVFNNGEEAISYLTKLIDEKVKLPDVILLDINLPKITGLEVLKKIKSNKSLKSIFTVIFTSSDSVLDMNFCYSNGANLYIKKPNDINSFKEVMIYIRDYL